MMALKTICIAAVTVLLLAGCESDVPKRSFPDIGFLHKAPYKLDVATIEVEKQPVAPDAGNVVHELPVTLDAVAEKWARQRLTAAGANGRAVVKIEKASVVEENLKKTGGLRGVFTTDQTQRYTADLAMSLSLSNDHGQGTVQASARKIRTIAEDATLAQREKLWFEMVEALAREVDDEMDRQITAHLTEFLR
jgi:polyhydroxyalkanoate synthesis regulator phasin